MLLRLAGRRLYYDFVGPEDAPVVCITHSLASDGGMWAEQMPPLLQAGFRVLRVDMRGHGGMIGQAFALEHGAKVISALWSDTLPASPADAAALWDERMNTVRRANS